jgi:hypothetical protein
MRAPTRLWTVSLQVSRRGERLSQRKLHYSASNGPTAGPDKADAVLTVLIGGNGETTTTVHGVTAPSSSHYTARV